MAAYEESLVCITMPANADLSSYQYYAVESTTGKASVCNSQGERALGILLNKPAAANRAATIAIAGVCKALAGGTIAAGANCTVTSAGKIETSAGSDHCLGVAMEAAVDGDIFPLLLQYRGTT